MAGVKVELGDRSYDVEVVDEGLATLGASLGRHLPPSRAVVVTEANVEPLWAAAAIRSLAQAGWAPEVIVLPAGEVHKTVDTWSSLVDQVLAMRIDRRTPLIALGGGVLGDIVGFAASAVQRGVPFVQVPTTLLAMVDSSVGGKTGVNHALGKNLVGAFYQPRLVHADIATLATLDARELRAGLAEAVKTALLGDPAFFEWLETHAPALGAGDSEALGEVVRRCVAIKARVVAEDEREAGLREILNLGHTVAHGLELVLGYGELRHGEAVAIGLVQEARWAERQGLCGPGVADRVALLLRGLGLATHMPEVDLLSVAAAMRSDKKARGAVVRVPVPAAVGDVVRVEVPHDRLLELLR